MVHTLRNSRTPGLSSSLGRIRPPVSVPNFFPSAASPFDTTGLGAGAGAAGAALGAGAAFGAGAGAAGAALGAGAGAGAGGALIASVSFFAKISSAAFDFAASAA